MWTLPSASYRTPASPPPIVDAVARSTPAARYPQGSSSSQPPRPAYEERVSAEPPVPDELGLPDAPSSFPDIERMSVRELQALAADAPRFENYIANHEHTRRVENTVATIRQQVEAFEVERTRSMPLSEPPTSQTDIKDLEKRIADVNGKISELRELQNDWLSRNSEDHLAQRLRDLILNTEKESEALVEQFNLNVIEYGEFMSKYILVRKQLAERKIKLETFEAQILQLKMQRAAQAQARPQ